MKTEKELKELANNDRKFEDLMRNLNPHWDNLRGGSRRTYRSMYRTVIEWVLE